MTETVAPQRRLIHRNVTIAELNLGTDKRGMPYANMKVDTLAQSGTKKGETIRIFAQVFGRSFEALKEKLVVGASLKVYGVHQTLNADEANNVAGCSSYVIYGERVARVAAPEPIAA